MGVDSPHTGSQTEGLCEREVVLRMAHDEAVGHVRSAFLETGFDATTESSPTERVGQFRESVPERYTILGFDVPPDEEHPLELADDRIGAFLPITVLIWEDEPGVQRVYHLGVISLAGDLGFVLDDESWSAFERRIEERVYDAFEELDTNRDLK